MLRIGLYGAAGNMGRAVIRAIAADDRYALAGGCERQGSPAVGADLGTLGGLPPRGIAVTDDPAALCAVSDVIVDYSAASATMQLLPVAAASGTPVLVCTTGFTADQHTQIAEAGRAIAVLVAANMSTSVIAMYDLVRLAAQRLGEEFDIEIFDFHPWDKIDAPSGTALELAACAAEGRGASLPDLIVTARHGETGRRRRGTIGFSSARGGEVTCENTVYFAGAGQRLEITSRVTDFAAFTAMTLRAAGWLARQGPGFYGMEQMLADMARDEGRAPG
jgi:4-hydroxy-tetrahydrodipicolinate reductase